MQIATLNGKAFAEGLSKVIKVKQANAILPVLESVHAKTGKKMLILTASNLETTIQTAVAADALELGKEFLIPSQACAILLQLKDESISIELTDILTFTFGENVMKFPLEKAEEFPRTPVVEATSEFRIPGDAKAIAKAFDNAKKYTSNDDLRPIMTGVQFTNKTLAATDAHRLIEIKLDTGCKEDFSIVVSKLFISALQSIDSKSENLLFKISASHISVNDKFTKIVSSHICGQFPAYHAVIPTEQTIHIELDRKELIENINRSMTIAAMSSDKRVYFAFKEDSYTMSGQDLDRECAITMKGSCEWKLNKMGAEKFDIIINSNFLRQVLELHNDDTITMEVTSSNKAATFRAEDMLMLVMPLMDLKS